MTDSPTMPIPLTPDAVRSLRRKGSNYRARRADLERAELGQLLCRAEALQIAARMSAWPDRWPEENDAVRALMQRHGLTCRQIINPQQYTRKRVDR